MARSWVGRTIVACWPCMAMLRLREARHSYMNCENTKECYECAVVSRKMVDQIRSSPTLRHKGHFAYEYRQGIPGAAPDTRSACRHEAGHGGNRRDASAVSPVCVTPPGARCGWRVETEWLPVWATPVAARCPRADPCRCWSTRGATGTRAGVSPTRPPWRGIALDNPPP